MEGFEFTDVFSIEVLDGTVMVIDESLVTYKKKLQKANDLIERIAADYPEITPITKQDVSLFQDFFAKEARHTYGNSWIYVTQGTFGIGPENLGYKYYDGENLCALAVFPKIEQPEILMMYWIRPVGSSMIPIIAELAEEIKQKYKLCSYVKKIFPDQYEYLLKHGFQSAKNFPWHSSAHSEDDTYPELIYDREQTLRLIDSPEGSRQLRRIAKDVDRVFNKYNVKVSADNFVEDAWFIARRYFDFIGGTLNKINLSSAFDYHSMLFSRKVGDVAQNGIAYFDGEPVGFYVADSDVEHSVTSIYAHIGLRYKYKYIVDCMHLHVFRVSKTKFINAGGSEDSGILAFKNKYAPRKENKMLWATNYFA
ncbi:MAG: hypothetical protein JXR42_01005 [Gammaproteobacteria bacterium]|nr:hypothetical protein [Gammaproteobacteria bacterium]